MARKVIRYRQLFVVLYIFPVAIVLGQSALNSQPGPTDVKIHEAAVSE
jgi:hypothetical protein